MLAPALTIGGLAVVTVALRLRDPHEGGWGVCPVAALGLACPGCGGLRAVNDLTNGDLLGAASSNLMVVAVVPVILVILGRWAWDAWAGRPRDPSLRVVVATTATYLVLLVPFTVLRNLPVGSWLAP